MCSRRHRRSHIVRGARAQAVRWVRAVCSVCGRSVVPRRVRCGACGAGAGVGSRRGQLVQPSRRRRLTAEPPGVVPPWTVLAGRAPAEFAGQCGRSRHGRPAEGEPVGLSFAVSWWRSLDALERWAESFTHVAIFGRMKYLTTMGPRPRCGSTTRRRWPAPTSSTSSTSPASKEPRLRSATGRSTAHTAGTRHSRWTNGGPCARCTAGMCGLRRRAGYRPTAFSTRCFSTRKMCATCRHGSSCTKLNWPKL
jgi:hypothetical protein